MPSTLAVTAARSPLTSLQALILNTSVERALFVSPTLSRLKLI